MSGYGKDHFDAFVNVVGEHLAVAGLARDPREGAAIARLGHLAPGQAIDAGFSVDEGERGVAALRCAATIVEAMSAFGGFTSGVGEALALAGHASAWHEGEDVARQRYLDELVRWFGAVPRFGKERCVRVCAKVVGRDLRRLYAATNYPRM